MKNALNFVRDISAAPELGPVDSPSFIETVGASLSYKYAPIMSRIEEDRTFPAVKEDGYSAVDNIPKDLVQYGSELIRATNQKHMDFLVSELRSGLKTREVLAKSGIIAQFGAEIFDPVNWITVPFTAGASLPMTAARAGAATASVVVGQELLRAPFDPLGTTAETAINIGSAFIIGSALGGLTSIPAARRIKVQQAAEKEIENLRTAIEPSGDAEFDASIAPSLFTDSWLYTGVTTPMKRILTDESIPNSVKLNTLAIANDAGVLLAGNKSGQALKPSVYQASKLYEGEWVSVRRDLQNIWGEYTGEGVTEAFGKMWKRNDFETWLAEVDRKAIQKIEPANDFEARAMESLNKFYSQWETRLNEEGQIGSRKYYEDLIARREREVESLQTKIGTTNKPDYRRHMEGQLARISDEIDEARAVLDEFREMGQITPPNEDVYRPRYWDRNAIDANPDKFRAILEEWYRENPRTTVYNEKTRKYERVTLSTDPESISYRVNQTIKGIMNETDPLSPDVAFYGIGKSKHFKHRTLDIPNALVLDFIERNPIKIMKAYVHRTAPRYEFSRAFGGRSIDDVIDDNISEMLSKGVPIEKAYAAAKDMRHLHDRVVGNVLRDPSSWDQKTARVLRDLAQLNYLGSAGISTLTEPAKIIMEHGLGPTFRGLFSIMKNNQLRMGKREINIAGEGLDNILGSAHMRLVDDLTNNPLSNDIWDKGKDAFYILNGLGPITQILKDFDGMLRVHTLIDNSVRLSQGKASKAEIEYLARYGIDADMAKKIANAPWQKGESGMYLANTEAWTNTIEFPATTAEIISGPTGKYKKDRYVPAFYRESEGKIYIDEEYIKDVMWRERAWKNPKVEGVNPIEDGIINSPDDLVSFIKMHEIMHTIYRPDDLGILGEKIVQKDFNVSIESAGFTFNRTYKSAKQISREIDLLDLEMSRQQELISAWRDAGVHPKDIEDEIASYQHNSSIRNELARIQDTKEYADQLMIEESGKPITKLNAEQKAAYENAINDLAVAEIKKQARVDPETVRTFRTALSSGVLNTILMGTPADKPTIVDGIVYIPMRVAKQFGMKEDPKYKGYARIENGLLGLPFQFYSYTLAAVNKTTAAMAHGQLKNQYIGTAIAMGLGYMVLQYKTPDFVEMSFQDQFARSFDYSGVAALYSDLLYTGMATSLALGGPNLTGGFLQPRFPQKPDAIDAATGLLGAGPSIGADISLGVYDIVTGNPGEGTKEVIRNLPFMRLWFLKGLVNNMTRAIETELDGPSGFGRY